MQLTFISLSPDDLRQVIREEVERAIRPSAKTSTEQPAHVTLDQAVEQYGVSKSFLYRLSSERLVTKRKVGRILQFDAKELESYFNQKTKKSLAAIDADLKRAGVFPTLKGRRHV